MMQESAYIIYIIRPISDSIIIDVINYVTPIK